MNGTKIAAAFNAAMRKAADDDGAADLMEAAARLADRTRFDDALRAEVAAFLVAHLIEPFGSVSREKFREINGTDLEERLREIAPSVERLCELEEEFFRTPVSTSYRQAMHEEEA